jgi:single-strand binding family protein
MSNPDNLVLLRGTIHGEVQTYFKKNSNEAIYIEFDLKVKRNYLNKGIQEFDYPRVKYAMSDFMTFANLKDGDEVSLVGSYKSEFYKYDNKNVKKQIMLAESIVANIVESDSQSNSSAEDDLQLPY